MPYLDAAGWVQRGESGQSIVALGGGHGLSATLRALRPYHPRPDGCRHRRRRRRQFRSPPPGNGDPAPGRPAHGPGLDPHGLRRPRRRHRGTPRGAREWARSDKYTQIFSYGTALGVQFHPEVTRETATVWAVNNEDADTEDIVAGYDAHEGELADTCKTLADWVSGVF